MGWTPNPDVIRWRSVVDKWCVRLTVSQSLVLAVIQMESGGKVRISRREPAYLEKYVRNNPTWQKYSQETGVALEDIASSYGLMQLMFPTARGFGCRFPQDLFDPDLNIRYGTAYLKGALAKHGNNVLLALAHYNGGFGGAKAMMEGRKTRATRYAELTDNLRRHFAEWMRGNG